ncbi:MAG: hypothetical protein IH577_01805 [Deltaproteobacteria bacterium]|nr:hypothetical protein [Deltaproteobacteria bacterium]
MLTDTKIGWLIALSDNENSDWGNTEIFYDSMLSYKDKKGLLNIRSETWGKLLRKDYFPRSGDGFAFYHTKRAMYQYADAYKCMPRISLMGILKNIKYEGQNVIEIEVKSHIKILNALFDTPIVRDHDTRKLFLDCGMAPGAVATFYKADIETWSKFLSLLKERISLEKVKGV